MKRLKEVKELYSKYDESNNKCANASGITTTENMVKKRPRIY